MTEFLGNAKRLEKSITRRYSIAVLILALLSTGAFYAMKSALSDSESTALVVNISGKQRMLSQHIALDVHRIHVIRFHDARIELDSAVKSLKSRTAEMVSANRRLSSGNLSENHVMPLSTDIREMFFGEMNLAQRVCDYKDLSLQILQADSFEESMKVVDQINRLSEDLLGDLNKVVFQYQKESEERLKFLSEMETFIWLFALFVLMLEVAFIFRPMVRSVSQAAKDEKAMLDSLQDQVELRTIKLEQANQRLMKLASHDPLTGVKNRLTMESEVEKVIDAYKEHQKDFGLVMVDIDWFKKVNDKLGHEYGDFVIKRFASLLEQHVRESDQVYRIGGEEFVLLMNRISLEEVLNKMEQLREHIQSQDFEYTGKHTLITASFGVFQSSRFKNFDFQEALRLADGALFQSKSLGRNLVSLAEQTRSTKTHRIELKKIRLSYEDADFTQLISVDYDIEGLLGYDTDSVLEQNRSIKSFIYEKDWDLLEKIKVNMLDKPIYRLTIRFLDVNHQVIICRLEVSSQAGRYQFCIQNVAELAKSFGDDLLVNNFHAMMDNTKDYIYFKDRNHVFTAASKSLVNLTSVSSREELVGKTDYDVFPTELADEYFILEKEVFSGEVEFSQRFQPTLDNKGNKGWVDNRKYPIKNTRGEIVGLFGIARTISDEDYQKLEHVK